MGENLRMVYIFVNFIFDFVVFRMRYDYAQCENSVLFLYLSDSFLIIIDMGIRDVFLFVLKI